MAFAGPSVTIIQVDLRAAFPFSRLADRIHSAYKGDREDVTRDFGGVLAASAISSAATGSVLK